MITIEKVYKEKSINNTRLTADINIEGKYHNLWYEVSDEYEEYLVDDRADAFIVAFINYAMLNGHCICSKVPVTDSLLYKLTTHYIPGLSNNNMAFKNIKIKAESINGVGCCAGAVGTGMSAGVDSFTTLLLNTGDSTPSGNKITHLTFFNVGAVQSSNTGKYNREDIFAFNNEDIKKDSQEINELRYLRAKKIADELNLPLVRVETNMLEIQPMKHKPLHSQRSISAVLALQKLFSVYYFASGFTLNQFEVSSKASGSYDIFSLAMFSTRTLEFISGDAAYSRIMKTALIKDNLIVNKHLNVCWREGDNCGKCDKCIRTLVTLDFIDALDKFNNVFDVNYYRKNRERNIAYTAFMSKKDTFYKQIMQYAEAQRINYKSIGFYYWLTFFNARLAGVKTKSFLKNLIR